MLRRVLCRAAFVLLFLASDCRATKADDPESSVTSQPVVDSDAAAKFVVPRNPRVLFVTRAGDENCRVILARLQRSQGDFDAMRARGWLIGSGPENHVQIVDRDAIPEIVAQLKVTEFPTVCCLDKAEVVRSFQSGCTTPLDAWTFGFLLNGKNERPATAVSETARVTTTGQYRLRGNHWSVDGDWNPTHATILSHLRSPMHNYRIASQWKIETWSYEELRSLHDDLHEQEQTSSGSSSSSSRSSSGTRWPKDFSNGIKR